MSVTGERARGMAEAATTTAVSVGLALRPGGAARVSPAEESDAALLEPELCGEEALLLLPEQDAPSPRRDRRARRGARSSSSDRETLASPGEEDRAGLSINRVP